MPNSQKQFTGRQYYSDVRFYTMKCLSINSIEYRRM